MRLGVLFSGGKDSAFAMYKTMENKKDKVVCLISIISKNKASYMFHTPNINLTKLQARAIGIPLMQKKTKGIKEDELNDLKRAIEKAKQKYKIEGIVTGAVASKYQLERIQKICNDLKLKCINPLWKKDQIKLLKEIVKNKFDVMITGIFAYPLNEDFLGKRIDAGMIKELSKLHEKYRLNPAGEGGEIETTALDAPFFKKKIEVVEAEKIMESENSGVLYIKKAKLAEK